MFLQQLRLLDGFDMGAMGHGSARYIHTITECAKLAFADREAWYGDPAFVDVPLQALLSEDYADGRRKLVTDESSPELRPGSPDHRAPRLPAFVANALGGSIMATGDPARSGLRGDTVHLDVVDAFGNLVSATPSGGWLNGAPVIPELGFCLGTRAQMFWLEEGLPGSLEAREAAPDHAFAYGGGPGRGTLPGPRHPGRGPTGPVGLACLSRPRRSRDGPAGGA